MVKSSPNADNPPQNQHFLLSASARFLLTHNFDFANFKCSQGERRRADGSTWQRGTTSHGLDDTGFGPTAVGDVMASDGKYGLPRVMTVKELSEYLRVHPSTIYKLLRRGELPGFRIGTDWRFNAEVIDRWCLERNMRGLDSGN